MADETKESEAKESEPKVRGISLEIEIDAPLGLVWRALTTPEHIARWFPPISGGSGARVGDSLLISWGEGMEWRTTVAAVEQGKHLRWLDDPGNPAVAVDWYLETRRGKTAVRIVHSGFGASSDWDDQFHATETGWTYFLFNLGEYLERHAGTPRVLVSERRKSPVPRDALWARLERQLSLTADSVRLGAGVLPMVAGNRIPPRAFWLRLPTLNDALLFVELESGGDGFHCGLWLSTYGLSEPTVAALRDDLRSAADRVFDPSSS